MKIPKLVQAELALIFITVIWGSTFTIIAEGLKQVSPIFFVALRFWIAVAVVSVLMRGRYHEIRWKTLLQGFLLSVALLGGFILQTLGLRDTSPSNSAFITSLCIPLVPILGFLIYRHKASYRTVLGIVMAALGMMLLLADKSDFSLKSGNFLTLLCAFLFAFHILFLGVFVQKTDYKLLIFVKMVCGAILCSIMAAVLETPYVIWDASFTFYILVLGVLATAAAFWIQGWAQQYSNPTHTALIFSLEPVFATIFAFWILNQGWTVKEWAGGILILAGILISEIRKARKPYAFQKSRIPAG
jgi:drug/metabolite transporter (DMT)-like permease